VKRVVIIGSDFSPSSLPPATRVRFFAKHLPEFGWEPIVLTTKPEYYDWKTDPENERLLPESLRVVRTDAWRSAWTRRIGIGDVGMRSLWYHWQALKRLCGESRIDLIFVPVPPSVPMVLGRLAYWKFGIPYVVDYIDPWVTEYYWKLPKDERPPKWPIAYAMSRVLEPFALKNVSHITGVSKGTTDSVIRTENLWKTYQMGAEEVHALRGVSFDVQRGEYLAIMGPSGSGKSTLMNLIGCLDTPTSGQYFLSTKLVSEMDDDELAHIRNKEIGFVFQTFNLLPRATALHNVELPLIYNGTPRSQRIEMAKLALQRVDLSDRINHKPNELSGGQRQRVAIARALVNNPAILLADEPTGNLDSKSGEAVMELLRELHRAGATLCMVTHDPRYARHAERTIHLFDGRIVEESAAVAAS